MLLMQHHCPDLAPTNEQLSTIYGYFPVGSGGYCAVEKNLTLGSAFGDPIDLSTMFVEDVAALNIDWVTAATLLAMLEQRVPGFAGGDRHAALMNQAIAAAAQAGRLSTECAPSGASVNIPPPPTTVATPPPADQKNIALPPPKHYLTIAPIQPTSRPMSGLGDVNICLQQLLGLIGNQPYPLADDLKQLVITNFGIQPKPFYRKPLFFVGAGVVVVGVAAFLFLRD